MNHFPYAVPDPDPAPGPEPAPAEPGHWPKLEAALAVVNRDLTATLPGHGPLILVTIPDGTRAEHAEHAEHVYVAMPDGSWQGNPVNEDDVAEGDPREPYDDTTALYAVADAAQETVMELLWQVWPICGEHRIGTHVRPPGTDADGSPDGGDPAGPPVWWCRGASDGDGHDVARVGELVTALPGKQRRALRRAERRGQGRR
ncbi:MULTISPECIES: hypothetical protein [unclassified Streptomyces]|uniref:hypothetical protein n=1 Tax=unclassified Streptomyces TaxID=2593676 RepID=UPI003804B422